MTSSKMNSIGSSADLRLSNRKKNIHRLSYLSLAVLLLSSNLKSIEAFSSSTVPKSRSAYSQPSSALFSIKEEDISSKNQSEEVANALSEVAAALKLNYEEESPTAEQELAQLLEESKQRETYISRLRFQLQELKDSLKENEEQKETLEKQYKTLEIESNSQNNKELKNALKELEHTRKTADKELKEANRIASQERDMLQNQIQTLEKELQETVGKMKQAQIDSEIKSNQEMQTLMKQQDKLQQEIKALNKQLTQVQEALDDSDRMRQALQQEIANMEKNEQKTRLEEKNILESLKQKFQDEKESLNDKLQAYVNDIAKLKQEKEDELKALKEDAEEEKVYLKAQIESLEGRLEELQSALKFEKEQTKKAKKEANEKVERQREFSKKVERNVKSVAAKDKKILKKQIWELESEKEDAKFKLYGVQRKAKDLQEKVEIFEKQLAELEATSRMEIDELENRLLADEMFYAKTKYSMKERMQGLVMAFQKRLVRRQGSYDKKVDQLKANYASNYETMKSYMTTQKQKEIDSIHIDNLKEAYLARKEFEAKIVNLQNEMKAAEDLAKEKRAELVAKYESKIENLLEKAAQEKADLIEEKKIAQEEATEAYDILMKKMTVELTKAAKEEEQLRESLDKSNMKIRGYEEERTSVRTLLRLAAKAARDKVSRKSRKY
ncbi:predicted protein [Chaetoceros tenuissimus]|uniref:Uncharacterized protein n=1 Tax=Chaetoceros tenuissimus TaxID=426638 RepID=A0AAD3CUW0_9STRA|nr:predicted protein [Chaetoceros tenuissimus]